MLEWKQPTLAAECAAFKDEPVATFRSSTEARLTHPASIFKMQTVQNLGKNPREMLVHVQPIAYADYDT